MPKLVRRFLTLLLCAALVGLGFVLPIAPPALAAGTPTGLRTVAVSSNAVALTWKPVSGAAAYRVQFSRSSSMKSFKTVDVDTNHLEWTYLDPEPSANSGRLRPNATYYFRVKVITKVDLNHNARSLSKYGARLRVKTTGTGSHSYLAPVRLTSTARSATSLYVSWTSRGPGIYYQVRFGTSAGLTSGRTKVFDYSGGVLAGLNANTNYFWQVKAITKAGGALSQYSAIKESRTRGVSSPAIKLADYNICGNSCGNWNRREANMLDSLERQAPHLIALQESTNSDDLINDYNRRANRAFTRVTGTKHANLAYDTTRFSLRGSGVHPWAADRNKDAVWAILADKADNGRRLFVVSVHFSNGNASGKRKREAVELVQLINQHSLNLPVVVAGDFNVSKRKAEHADVYGSVSRAGLVDPLGNPSDSRYISGSATVEHRIDVSYSSANKFQRRALRSKWENGYDVDYIWHSRGVRVGMFQVVVDLDAKGNFLGTIPSDHNMLVSSFHLS